MAGDRLSRLMSELQLKTGIQLGEQKRNLVETRLFRRARILGLHSIDAYLDYFEAHKQDEMDHIVSVVSTHTTSFYRESSHFDYMVQKILPHFDKPTLRIWSGASSTGQEAYTLAMVCEEYYQNKTSRPQIEIFGTDIDNQSVKTAQEGIFKQEEIGNLNPMLVQKYFDIGKGDLSGLYRVKDHIHRYCSFEVFNIINEPFKFKPFDLIFLRNVLIYFSIEDIKKISAKLPAALNRDGYIFVGHSETLSQMHPDIVTTGNSIYQIKSLQNVTQMKPTAVHAKQIKVLIVDDSQTVCTLLKKIFDQDKRFEVVAVAHDPIEAAEILKTKQVDVVTLDIEMPRMTGVEYLESIQGKSHPAIVVISAVSYESANAAMRCFELGAYEYIEKPSMSNLTAESERIQSIVANAAGKRFQTSVPQLSRKSERKVAATKPGSGPDLILVGASTGGVTALKDMFMLLPNQIPPVVVVQHIPGYFSKAFAERLDSMTPFKVKEANDGEELANNTVYIAPGGKQMKLVERSGKLVLSINDDPPVNRHKPSVDYLFDSALKLVGKVSMNAALMTGMGRDGAAGLKKLKDAGIYTVAQNEATCVVYGMPKAAIEMGGASTVVALDEIAREIMKTPLALKKAG